MAATGFHSKSILSASTNNFRSWKLGEREREYENVTRGKEKKNFDRYNSFVGRYFFYYEDCEKGFSRITFLVFGSGKRAIYGGEMKETGESLDLEQRSGETLADARHGSR